MASVYNVVIDGIIDTSENCAAASGTLLLGDGGNYGENMPDSMQNVTVSNVICNSRRAVNVAGFLSNSVIANVVNKNPNCEAISVVRKDGLKNVTLSGCITVK